MTFDDLLLRADDQVLQELVGVDVVRVLRHIDPTLATPTRLRNLLSDFKPPSELLRDAHIRMLLLELLPSETARYLKTWIGIPSADEPFTALRKLNVRKGSAQEARLFQFFGEIVPEDEDHSRAPQFYSAQSKYPLFKHQRRAVASVQEYLSSDRRRVLLHMPTGSGKTRAAMTVIAEHLRSYEPTLVIWLAFSDELCEQAIEEFDHAWACLGNRAVDVMRFWGSNQPNLSSAHDGFLVAGLGKMYNYATTSVESITALADRVSLVVIDEAHQSLAPTYKFVLDVLVEKRATTSLLGLSATPGRTWDDVDQDRRLAELFRRQKVTLQVEGFSDPIEYLVANGFLARPTFSALFCKTGHALSAADLLHIQIGLDIPLHILDRIAADEQRNLRIVQRTEQLLESHRRLILFAASVRHAKLLAMVLEARGVVARAITADTTADRRRGIVDKFRESSDQPMVLCNYGVLTSGFDAPRTSAAIIARPTKSLVLYSQMIGRALRGPLAGGNSEAQIVTVVDTNLPGFGHLTESFFNWEDVWNE